MTAANGIAHLTLDQNQQERISGKGAAALAGTPSLQATGSLPDRLRPTANGVAATMDGMPHPATADGPATEARSPIAAASLKLLFEEQHRCNDGADQPCKLQNAPAAA